MNDAVTMRVMLAGTDEVTLEPIAKFLHAINEVDYRQVILNTPDALANYCPINDDACIYALSNDYVAELQPLQNLLAQHDNLRLILVPCGLEPLPKEVTHIISSLERCELLETPFTLQALLEALDDIHDQLLQAQALSSITDPTDQPPHSMIAIHSLSGGAGSSLISACLAHSFANKPTAQDYCVQLMDGDWRFGTQGLLHRCRITQDIQQLFMHGYIDDTLLKSYAVTPQPNLKLWSTAANSNELALQSSGLKQTQLQRSIAALCQHFKQQAGITLIDIPVWQTALLQALQRELDHIVLVMQPDLEGIHRANLAIKHWLKTLSLEQITVVANKTSRFSGIDAETLGNTLAVKPIFIPMDERTVIHALESKRLPVVSAPNSNFSKSLKPLIQTLQPDSAAVSSSIAALYNKLKEALWH